MTAMPLAGIRVLDFAWIGAGALVTKALSELGAEILRIESVARPDNLRFAPPKRPGTDGLEASGYFASRNPGKKSIALDMTHPKAREIALGLAASCQVFTSNFRPGVLERWGLTYDDVRAVNPSIVFLVMPMQGSDGPHRSYIGFGSTIAALSGLVHASGVPGRPPIGTGTHYPDHVPNPGHALVGLLAAIYHQQRTGQGQLVEVSQFESTVNVVGPGVLAASLGEETVADGNHQPGAVPRGAYRCKDGAFLTLSCRSEAHWRALVAVLEQPAWLDDDRFASASLRKRDEEDLDKLVAGVLATRDRSDWLPVLAQAGVPSGPVNTSKDVLSDPHLEARGFWQLVDHPVIGEIPMFHIPFTMDGVPRGALQRPPLLGEHTREVVTELIGLSGDEYDSLAEEGVFR